MNCLTFEELTKSDFYTFFHCTVSGTEEQEDGILVKVKTGAFQEFIDIDFHINVTNEIFKAKLSINREWIGNIEHLNPLGKDLTKSFIGLLTPEKEKGKVKDLINLLFYQKGSKDKFITFKTLPVSFDSLPIDLKKILDVYIGEYHEMFYFLSSSIFHFQNAMYEGKTRLLIVWKAL